MSTKEKFSDTTISELETVKECWRGAKREKIAAFSKVHSELHDGRDSISSRILDLQILVRMFGMIQLGFQRPLQHTVNRMTCQFAYLDVLLMCMNNPLGQRQSAPTQVRRILSVKCLNDSWVNY